MKNYLISLGFTPLNDNHFKYAKDCNTITVYFYEDVFTIEAHIFGRSTVYHAKRVPVTELKSHIQPAINNLINDNELIIKEATDSIAMLKEIKL